MSMSTWRVDESGSGCMGSGGGEIKDGVKGARDDGERK